MAVAEPTNGSRTAHIILVDPNAERCKAMAAALTSSLTGVEVEFQGDLRKLRQSLLDDQTAAAVVMLTPFFPSESDLPSLVELGATGRFACLADDVTDERVVEVMRSGAGPILIAPATVAELTEVLGLTPASGAALPGTTRLPDSGAGRVLSVISAKGGVGKTLVATNLAVAAARQFNLSVLLVDCDLYVGDVGMLLNIKGADGLDTMVERLSELDDALLGELIKVGPGGIRVLLAPNRPEAGDLVTAPELSRILAPLRRRFDLLILDTSSQLSDVTIELMEASDELLLLTTSAVADIHKTLSLVRLIKRLGISVERVKLGVNRSDSHGDFSLAEIEESLGLPVALTLPSIGKAALRSVNQGRPLALTNPEVPFVANLRDFLGQLGEHRPLGSRKKTEEPLLRRLFSRSRSRQGAHR